MTRDAMKTITVTMTDEVYRQILRNSTIRSISGQGYGVMDAAISKIIKAVKDGEDVVNLAFKKDAEIP